jgi:hypothetical protein
VNLQIRSLGRVKSQVPLLPVSRTEEASLHLSWCTLEMKESLGVSLAEPGVVVMKHERTPGR